MQLRFFVIIPLSDPWSGAGIHLVLTFLQSEPNIFTMLFGSGSRKVNPGRTGAQKCTARKSKTSNIAEQSRKGQAGAEKPNKTAQEVKKIQPGNRK